MRLSAEEFIRRFLQHILSKGLMRIRHYGFLANRCRAKKLSLIRRLLNTASEASQVNAEAAETGLNGYPCPKCRSGHLKVVGERSPARWKGG
ncbi:MAG: transposase [Candidatus Thiodiazotropha sp. (ex Epidulcina cf. delphinae)]|nr:transposase [Candidatus Thiodiazotropha sp. (ex Epidulcina cf. delphinae)]